MRNDEQKPRGGFGLPPSSVMSLEEASKNVIIKEAKGNVARRMLAQLSRQVASYSYSTPEGGTCLFAYVPGKSEPIGVIVFTIADESTDRNTLEFQFIHQRYQRLGIGKRLLLKAMAVIAAHNRKQVYLEAAEQSVDFYKKVGFTDRGNMIETAGPGAAIFHHIYPMTRQTADLACH